MSAKRKKGRTSLAMIFCASRSPSTPWPTRSNGRFRTRSANCASLQQTRQQSKSGQQRPATLPRLQSDVGPGMAIDLPDEVIGTTGKGRRGLQQTDQSEQFAFALTGPPAPKRRRLVTPNGDHVPQHSLTKKSITVRV